MDKQVINQILIDNQKNYDLIASHFDQTRSILWPEVEATSHYITPKSLVLDVGCGNGRLFPFVEKLGGLYLGFDSSEELIKISQQKYGKEYFFVGDILKIDQNSHNTYYIIHNTFNVIYCLAVIHHIPSHELRLQALKNLKSLLKPNSLLILSVWNLWQKKYLKYIIKKAVLKLMGKSKLDWGDCYIPYKAQSEKRKAKNLNLKLKIVQRYLHAFSLNELTNLVTQAGFQILEKKSSRWNYLIIAKK